MTKKSKIVFHHVPKCGGMSITAGLAISYFPFKLLRYGKPGFSGGLNARAASEAAGKVGQDIYAYRRSLLPYTMRAERMGFVFGHNPFVRSVFEDFKAEWNFITLLRHPLERWYSEYFWNRYKDHDYAKTGLDLEAYLQALSGQIATKTFTIYFSEKEKPEEALETLKELDVVGVLENMEDFKARLGKLLGRKPYFPKRNSSPASAEQKIRADVNSAFHKDLLYALEGDIMIYRKMREHMGLPLS